ncbi:MAG: methyl-accepting chemotaxis protein [Gemmatimonadales bacterium]|nr:methyl-accepting chemotaxis protein [Gemmatimonadales bacterium]
MLRIVNRWRRRWRDVAIGRRLGTLVALGTLGVVAVAVGLETTAARVRVGGPVFASLERSAELVADVLPPPVYVIEPYLLAHQVVTEADPAARAALAARVAPLRAEAESRYAHWQRTLPAGPLRTALAERALPPARRLLDTLEHGLLPAVAEGRASEARRLLDGPLHEAYAAHRAAIDEVVHLSRAEGTAVAATGATEVRRAQGMALGAVLGVVLLLAAAGRVLATGIATPLGRVTDALQRVAEGDLAASAGVEDASELGRLSRALDATVLSLRRAEADRAEAAREREARQVEAARLTEAARRRAEADARDALALSTLLDRFAAVRSEAAALETAVDVLRDAYPDLGLAVQRAASPAQGFAAAVLVEGVAVGTLVAEGDDARVIEESQRRVLEQAARLTGQACERLRALDRERRAAAAVQEGVDALLGAVEAAAAGDISRPVPSVEDRMLNRMREALDRHLDALRASLGAMADEARRLDGAAEGLAGTAAGMRAAVDRTSERGATVAALAAEAAGQMDAMASATGQMHATVREIATSTQAAARAVDGAVEATRAADVRMGRLRDSTAAIGEVLALIRTIAEQINLLALNAGIEAARAGQAGKGFGVVAGEVKLLAQRTAEATRTIGRTLGRVGDDTAQAVDALRAIVGAIDEVQRQAGTITGAVDDLSSTTREVARSAGVGAESVRAISADIADVSRSAADGREAAADAEAAAVGFGAMATELRELAERFHLGSPAARSGSGGDTGWRGGRDEAPGYV